MSPITETNLHFQEDIAPNGAWVIENVGTPDPAYQFTTFDSVWDFANAMKSGIRDNVLRAMRTGFVNPPEPEVMYKDLLDDCNVLQFQSLEVYSAVEVGSLDNFLLPAGAALVAVTTVLKYGLVDRGTTTKSIGLPQSVVSSENREESAAFGAVHNLDSSQPIWPDCSIEWKNYTNVDFGLSYISCDKSEVTHLKKPTPEANGIHYLRAQFSQELSWYQFWTSVSTEGSLTITHPSGMEFAVQIHAPTQVISIGTSPYFRIGQSDNSAGAGGFNWCGEYRSEGYSFPRLPKNLGEMKVRAEATHKTLRLTVTITPPRQG